MNTRRFLTLLLLPVIIAEQGQRIAERPGYPKNAKLLIILADDLGVSHSQNMASIGGLQNHSDDDQMLFREISFQELLD